MNTEPDPLLGNSISGLMGIAMSTPPPSTPTTPWQAPMPEEVAALLPQYHITRMIGRGGMGAVYQGTQLSLNRAIALKLLPTELSANADFVSRFTREAQTLASLSHQGIVTIFDFGTTSAGHLYFVMEFIDGTDLAHLLHAQRLEPAQALELTIQICEALHFAHARGVVHRDIKPANVLLTQDGRAKLADFGLARPLTVTLGITAASMIMGTPEYMAPEQWAGKVDHRADIYALGVMLYEMLTGTRPQGAFDLPSIKSHVDARLDEVIVKAMRQAPEQRYQHVSELRDAVQRIRTTEPPHTNPNPAPSPPLAPSPVPAGSPARPTPQLRPRHLRLGCRHRSAARHGCCCHLGHAAPAINGFHRLKALLTEIPVQVLLFRVNAEDGWLGDDDTHGITGVDHDLFQPDIVTESFVAAFPADEVFQRRRLMIHGAPTDARIGFPKAVWVRELDHAALIGLHHDGVLVSRDPAAYLKQPTTPRFATGRRGEEAVLSRPFDEEFSLAGSLVLTVKACQFRRKMASCSRQESGG